MRDGNDVRSEILEMAIERRRLFEELEFDHVTVMAVVGFDCLFCSLFILSSFVRVCLFLRFVVFAFVVSASSSSSSLLLFVFSSRLCR